MGGSLPRQTKLNTTLFSVNLDSLIVWEGLPHPFFEPDNFKQELRKETFFVLHGYHFYRETLQTTRDDGRWLMKLLCRPTTLLGFSGAKDCGGFHPDYGIEFLRGDVRLQFLLCFGCGEAKVFGPGHEVRHDLADPAHTALRTLLQPYGSSRPTRKNP